MSWTLIEHQALTTTAATVTLGSGGTIPQTYKSLMVVFSTRTNGSNVDAVVNLNGSTSSYSVRWLYGNGSAAGSGNSTATAYAFYTSPSTYTASTFASGAMSLPNYTSTNQNKPWSADSVNETNATGAFQGLNAGLRTNTAAITSIDFKTTDGSFVSGSTFTLYGLA